MAGHVFKNGFVDRTYVKLAPADVPPGIKPLEGSTLSLEVPEPACGLSNIKRMSLLGKDITSAERLDKLQAHKGTCFLALDDIPR